ncbi:MAG: AMP-binding protein [Melioribacteraceae bacterium]|nr:AMP-binding protein [Melioribacteraceae bacterium]
MFLKNHNNTAIVNGDQKISYDQLISEINYYSSLTKSISADKVAIFAENSPGWIYTLYSAWKNESTVVPIDFMSTAEDVFYILNDCKPEIVFTSLQCEDVLSSAIENLDYKPEVFVIDNIESPSHKYDNLDFPDFDDDKTLLIIYTSGTTGSPKGVMLTKLNLLTNLLAVTNVIRIYTKDDRMLVLLPLHHIFPLLGTIVAPLYVGATIALSPSMSGEDIMNTLQANKITLVLGVPRLYALIRKGIKDKINKSVIAKLLFSIAEKVNSRSFSKKIFKQVHQKFGGHVKHMICGGAAFDIDVARDYKTLGFEILEGFGMTEAAPMITFTRPGRVKIGSPGEVLPASEIKIIDGEICAKGPNIMKGYYNRPEETSEVLIDGWLHTGDLGYLDEEGFLFVTGRRKEIIVLSSGKNINPEEVEQKLTGSDMVSEAAVFLKDEQLHAVIVPDFVKMKELEVSNYEEAFRWKVIDKYNQKVTPYKKISGFTLYNEPLPRTRLSKLKRFMLSELIVNSNKNKSADVIEPDTEEYRIIKNFLSQQKDITIHPKDHIEMDIGLDSLDKVTLQVFLQSTFGVVLKDEHLMQYSTVEKLAEFIAESKSKIEVEEINWGEILQEKIPLKLPESWLTWSVFKFVSKLVLRVYFRLKVDGQEKLPEGPIIITPNHQSFYDGMFVSIFLKNKLFRKTYFYAKEKHVANKLMKFIADKHNIIVLDINKELKQSLQKMAAVLEKGKSLIIFPEGTRTTDGSLGKFKKTFAILSKELNVPIVPVSIKGAFEALPKGKLIPKPFKKIRIKFLDPVYPENHSYENLTNIVFNKLRSDS